MNQGSSEVRQGTRTEVRNKRTVVAQQGEKNNVERDRLGRESKRRKINKEEEGEKEEEGKKGESKRTTKDKEGIIEGEGGTRKRRLRWKQKVEGRT